MGILIYSQSLAFTVEIESLHEIRSPSLALVTCNLQGFFLFFHCKGFSALRKSRQRDHASLLARREPRPGVGGDARGSREDRGHSQGRRPRGLLRPLRRSAGHGRCEVSFLRFCSFELTLREFYCNAGTARFCSPRPTMGTPRSSI